MKLIELKVNKIDERYVKEEQNLLSNGKKSQSK
jgi:hypothetical protein